jgi:DNA modification methylase
MLRQRECPPYYSDGTTAIYPGDVREILPMMAAQCIHCVVTSPPYWGLRDYGVDRQLGVERTPEEYVSNMVAVFREVRRILRDDGTLWLNMGDSYATGTTSDRSPTATGKHGYWQNPQVNKRIDGREYGLKPKDLCGIPWMLAFALRADGWWLRQDIIWAKPNPMPESVTDRCTKSHEYIFLLSKGERYYYDAEAIKEESVTTDPRRPYTSQGAWELDGRPDEQKHGGEKRRTKVPGGWDTGDGAHGTIHRDGLTSAEYVELEEITWRNRRSVWTVATQPFPEAHFATFPEDLIKPCILAGCPAGGTVFDPFLGSGTTALVAAKLHCKCVGIELNPAYIEIAAKRLSQSMIAFSSDK